MTLLGKKTFCSSFLSSEFGFLYSSNFIHGPAQLVFLIEYRIWKPKCSPYIIQLWMKQKYLKFEESSGDPARVQVLYERAVSELPVSSDLWIGYTSYLDRSLKVLLETCLAIHVDSTMMIFFLCNIKRCFSLQVPSVLRSVYYRATRNCTWVAELWVHYLLSLERIHSSEEELRHVSFLVLC